MLIIPICCSLHGITFVKSGKYMKIMYLLFSFTVGGTEHLVSDICNEMIKRDNDVYLYIVNKYYDQEMLDHLDNRVHIVLQNRKINDKNKLKPIFAISEFIITNHIEVVHCNSFAAPRLLLLKPLLFPNTKIIHTIHDVGQYKTLSRIEIKIRNRLCDRFIAISDSVSQDIISAGADNNKVTTIYNAINLVRFRDTGKKKVFDKNEVIIGNVARFVPEKKGQDILIEAIKLLKKDYPGIRCYFAGDYDAAHAEVYKKIVKNVRRLGLQENITFLGNVSNIPDFLKKIDIFVLPSRFEGFGISLIEAMAMGKPVVASNLDGPAELLCNGQRGEVFTPGNSSELTEKIKTIIENYSDYQLQAIDNQKFIVDNFNIVTMVDRLVDVYEEK